MPKTPKIKHGYDHDKDKMKISIRGYALSKTTRDEILETLVRKIERSRDRVSRPSSKSGRGRKVLTLENVGD